MDTRAGSSPEIRQTQLATKPDMLALFTLIGVMTTNSAAQVTNAPRAACSAIPVPAVVNHPKSNTLLGEINRSIASYYSGRTAAGIATGKNGTWDLFQGWGDTVLNTNCWAYGLDFSGFISRGMNQGGGPVALITSRHGISCEHAWDWTPGNWVYAVGKNGVKYTNWIQTTAGMGDDVRLVTFSNNFPAQITPFMVLPTNYASKVRPYNWKVCWYRANSLHLATAQTAPCYGNTNYIQASSKASDSAFNETGASGGDSGGPMWCVLNNKLVFLCAINFGCVAGPFISNAKYHTNIVAAIGTNTLNVIDVSSYPDI